MTSDGKRRFSAVWWAAVVIIFCWFCPKVAAFVTLHITPKHGSVSSCRGLSCRDFRLSTDIRHHQCLGGTRFATAGKDDQYKSERRRQRQSLARWKPKISLPVLSRVSELQAYLIPPIPLQDTSKMPLHNHFRPRFVAREATLGARMMIRLYCALAAIGVLFDMVVGFFPVLPAVQVSTLSSHGGIHLFEILSKSHIYTLLSQPPEPFRVVIAGPILEEVFYRGIGFAIIYWDSWCLQYLWSAIAGFVPVLSVILAGQTIRIRLQRLLRMITRASSISLLELIRFSWIELIPAFLHAHLHLRILQKSAILRLEKSNLKSDDDDFVRSIESSADAKCSDSPSVPEKHMQRCLRIVNRATRRRQRTRNNSSVPLARLVQQRLLDITRWKTSALFASAHVPTRQSGLDDGSSEMGSNLHYSYLRKFGGVFCSSLLVESRLVIRRGTIWGAMGAHMMFNFLASVRLMIHAIFLTQWPNLDMHPFGKPALALLILAWLQVLLHIIDKWNLREIGVNEVAKS